MAKRSFIVVGCLVVFVGVGCLGLTSAAGLGAYYTLAQDPGEYVEREYSEFGDHSGPAMAVEPMVEPSVDLPPVEADTELDSEADTDADTEAIPTSTSSARPRRTSRPSSAPAPRPFSAPEAVDAPVPEEENLDDLELERTAIEIIDEELSPRELRRLRRQERD